MRVWVIASMMALLALAGCLEGGSDNQPIDSECPADDHMDSHESMESEAPDDEETATANETATTNDTFALRMQPAEGNETGDANETNEGNDTVADEPMDDETVAHEDADPCAPEEVMTTMAGAYVGADVMMGEAPFDVTFDFGVTEIPADEFLSWTLDVNGDDVPDAEGNGNNLPGNFTYTYTAAGEFNVTFIADDGIDAWNATMMITATEAAEEEEETPGEPAGPVGPFEQAFEGHWMVDSPRCAGGPSGLADTTYASMTVDELTWGQSFFADFTGGFLVAAVAWVDGSGADILVQEDTDEGEFYEITGKVPANAVEAHFYTCITPTGPNLGSVNYITPAP